MQGDQIRERLHSGETVYGTHVTLMSNSVAASMLAAGPLDFVFLCAEHMPLDRTETSALCCLYANRGISPVVRIPHPCPVEAAKALDAGAQGIVAPYVETVEQVRDLVGAVHYRPLKGRVLRDFLSGQREPDTKTTTFLARFNQHSYAIVGVESIPAYENLDALIGVAGVDGVFIGPHDLSVSMEAAEEWDNPEFHRILDDIVVRCRAAGVGVGIHLNATVFPAERVRHLIELGMNWILDAADVVWAIHALKERRQAIGMPAPDGRAGSGRQAVVPCAK